MLFRGYPLQTLTRANLAWLGVLLTSVPFAAVHLRNPNVVPGFTFINTALAGLWLAVAYLRTRSFVAAAGIALVLELGPGISARLTRQRH